MGTAKTSFPPRNSASAYSCSCLIVVIESISAITALYGCLKWTNAACLHSGRGGDRLTTWSRQIQADNSTAFSTTGRNVAGCVLSRRPTQLLHSFYVQAGGAELTQIN